MRVVILRPSYCRSEANVLQDRTGGVLISLDNTIPKVDAPDDCFIPLRLVVRHGLAGKVYYHVEPWEKGLYVTGGAQITIIADVHLPFKSLPLYDRIPAKLLSGDDEEV